MTEMECSDFRQVIDIDLKRSEQVRRWWPFLRDRRIDQFAPLQQRFID